MSDLSSVLDRLAPVLGRPAAEPAPLEGGLTNRNYRARFGHTEAVIRVPGRDTDLLGIDRAAEGEAAELAASLGITPAVLARLDDPPCLVSAFAEGRVAEAGDFRQGPLLERVAAGLRLLHGASGSLPVSFSAFEITERYAQITRERGGEVPAAYDAAHARAREIRSRMSGAEHEPVCCHNDLLAANLLVDGDDWWLIDWDYAAMGDRWFDLGNLAVNNDLDAAAEDRLLEAYFGEPADDARRATLHDMRFMSDFREAMWGVVQSAVSDLDFDFRGYAGEHFERLGL